MNINKWLACKQTGKFNANFMSNFNYNLGESSK